MPHVREYSDVDVGLSQSILTAEARHDAWVASAVNKGAAWNIPYDTPLDLSAVFSLAC
jgi:hypothetical protein